MRPSSTTLGRATAAVLAGLLLLTLSTLPDRAEATEHESGIWGIFSVAGKLGDSSANTRWGYWFDAQQRLFDVGSGITQTLLRPALSYEFDNGVSVWAGYAYVNARRASGQRVEEHRPWQQMSWTAKRTDRGSLSMRLRLEQRDVEIGNDLGWTLRYQLKYAHRLGASGRWQAIGFVEPFVALRDTDWGGSAGLQQNRVFLGASYDLNSNAAVEFGYLNQYLRRGSAEDLANHLGVMHLKMRF